MPLSQSVKYRVKTMPSGAKIRLAFTKNGGDVVEAKNLASGARHTEAEFKADRKRRGSRLKAAMMGGSSHTSNAMR